MCPPSTPSRDGGLRFAVPLSSALGVKSWRGAVPSAGVPRELAGPARDWRWFSGAGRPAAVFYSWDPRPVCPVLCVTGRSCRSEWQSREAKLQALLARRKRCAKRIGPLENVPHAKNKNWQQFLLWYCHSNRTFLKDTNSFFLSFFFSNIYAPLRAVAGQLPAVPGQPLSVGRQPLAVNPQILLANSQPLSVDRSTVVGDEPTAVVCRPAQPVFLHPNIRTSRAFSFFLLLRNVLQSIHRAETSVLRNTFPTKSPLLQKAVRRKALRETFLQGQMRFAKLRYFLDVRCYVLKGCCSFLEPPCGEYPHASRKYQGDLNIALQGGGGCG